MDSKIITLILLFGISATLAFPSRLAQSRLERIKRSPGFPHIDLFPGPPPHHHHGHGHHHGFGGFHHGPHFDYDNHDFHHHDHHHHQHQHHHDHHDHQHHHAHHGHYPAPFIGHPHPVPLGFGVHF